MAGVLVGSTIWLEASVGVNAPRDYASVTLTVWPVVVCLFDRLPSGFLSRCVACSSCDIFLHLSCFC